MIASRVEWAPIGSSVLKVSTWDPGRAGSDALITYIDIGSVNQDAKSIGPKPPIPAREAPSRARQLVRTGDILVSTVRPNLNAVARIPENFDGATASTGFCVLRPDETTLAGSYLFHWVKSPHFITEMVRKATGASYPAVSDRTVLESLIPMPPLAEQRRIAAILDQAEALRAKRRQALAQADNLLRSLFLDLFGNPATNPKRWHLKPLGQIGRVVTGNTPSRENPAYYGDEIEWIKSDNINTPYHYLTRAEEGLSAEGIKVARVVPPGSILVTCIAGSPSVIGNAAIADRQVAFNQQINALVPPVGDFRFLYAQILVGKRLVQQASTEAMKGMVSKSRFENVPLMFPPIELQLEFGARFDAILGLTAKLRGSQAELDRLFASLQDRAFRGGL